MQKIIKITVLLILTAIVALVLKGNKLFSEKQNDTAYYKIDVPVGLDTMDYHVKIKKDNARRVHILKLPNGGTFTTVYIYKGVEKQFCFNAHRPNLLFKESFNLNQKIEVNISHFLPGYYTIVYNSCSIGGSAFLQIE